MILRPTQYGKALLPSVSEARICDLVNKREQHPLCLAEDKEWAIL